MDAVDPCFVRRRGHHAPLAVAANDDRLAPQLGSAIDLDRREECIHVDVQDGRRPESARPVSYRRSTLSSRACPEPTYRNVSPRG